LWQFNVREVLKMGGVIRSGLQRALSPVPLVSVVVLATVLALGQPADEAWALPPAGTDTLAASGQATIASRLGAETITLNGTVTVQHGTPFLDSGVMVANAEITSMSLTGTSAIGPIAVIEHGVNVSSGELRALQPAPPEYPATSFFDMFTVVTIPANPSPTLQLQNNIPVRVTVTNDLTEWPPVQEKFASTALDNVDNDGDTMIDEDTSDDDGDHMYDEDGPPAGDTDTDGLNNEDPAAVTCASMMLATCNDDADAQVDEDPECTPLMPTLPIGACIVSISLTLYGDTDQDGCTNVAEMQTAVGSQVTGGLRDPDYIWDFMDVPAGSPASRDKAVSASDIGSVVGRYGSVGNPNGDPLSAPPPAPAYHVAFDRNGSDPAGDPWDLLPPNGSVSAGDIGVVVSQFGHSCVVPPTT
jgi:hypothetical protein